MNIFKTIYTKSDMQAADDSKWAPSVTMVPTDDPGAVVPGLWNKRKWPAHVENVTRPRFGRGAGYQEK